MNHSNFDWSKSEFNQQYQKTKNAVEFIEVWRKTTSTDPSNGYATASSCDEAEISMLSNDAAADDFDIPPNPKRALIEDDRNPLDISIEKKKIGEKC